MTERKLSPWCKAAKIAMIERDISVNQLADAVGMDRRYVSTILNGRGYSSPAVKKISDYLGIQDSESTTVTG